MLTSIVISGVGTTSTTRRLVLPVRDSAGTLSSFFIGKAEGLDPVNASVGTSSYPDVDGEVLHDGRVGGRNLVIAIGFRPKYELNETVQILRQKLYKIVPPKTKVVITINDDEFPQLSFTGTVEVLSATIWDKQPAMQLSIVSGDSYLTDTTIIQDKMYPMNTTLDLAYPGTAGTGFELDVNFPQNAGKLWIEINGLKVLEFTYPFVSGTTFDTVTINTIDRQKFAVRSRTTAGVVSQLSLLDYITAGSLGLFLDAATDTFGVFTDTGSKAMFALTYSAKYVGV